MMALKLLAILKGMSSCTTTAEPVGR